LQPRITAFQIVIVCAIKVKLITILQRGELIKFKSLARLFFIFLTFAMFSVTVFLFVFAFFLLVIVVVRLVITNVFQAQLF
jgi:hypothetical protein